VQFWPKMPFKASLSSFFGHFALQLGISRRQQPKVTCGKTVAILSSPNLPIVGQIVFLGGFVNVDSSLHLLSGDANVKEGHHRLEWLIE
jgi:hypothetical protein